MAPTTEGWSRWRLHPSVVRGTVYLRTHRRLDHFTEIEELGPTGLRGPSLRDPRNSRIMLDGAPPHTQMRTRLLTGGVGEGRVCIQWHVAVG